MIFPHNRYEAQHETGLKIPLYLYLKALTAKRWTVDGAFTFNDNDDDDEYPITYNNTELGLSHLRTDNKPLDTDYYDSDSWDKEWLTENEIWLWPENEAPNPWRAYGQKIPNDDGEAVLNRVWLGQLNPSIPANPGGSYTLPDRYDFFQLPMGGGRASPEGDPAGQFSGLNYADPTQDVVVRFYAIGTRTWQYWAFDLLRLTDFFVSAEGLEDIVEGLLESGESLSWDIMTVGYLKVDGVDYPITAKLPTITKADGSLAGYGVNLKSSTITLTAHWD
ncbi:MAG: hypothetical protein QM680_13385 [Luteolibacter sp.]